MNQTIRQTFARQFQRLRGDGIGATLVRGAGGAFVVRVVGTGLAFGLHVFLARYLGAGVYGEYIYVFTWVSILVLFSNVGFENASLRFVSAYHGQGEWKLLRGFIRRAGQISVVASSFVAVFSAGLIWLLRDRLGKDLEMSFWVGFMLLPVMVWTQLYSAQVRALKRVVLAKVPLAILRPIALAGGVFIAIELFGSRPSAATVLGIELAVLVGLLLVVWRILHNSLPPQFFVSSADYHTAEWVGVSFSLLLISGLFIVNTRMDVLMLGVFRGTTEAGIYTAAARIADLVVFGLAAVNMIAAPMISELFAQGRKSELQRMVTLAARGIFAFSLPACLVIIISGKSVLELFGSEFLNGYPVLVILAGGQLVNALAGSVGLLMTMTGHQRVAARVIGSAALLNIVLNAALIPVYGKLGAAIATAVATAFWNVVMFVFVRKYLGINPSVFPFSKCPR